MLAEQAVRNFMPILESIERGESTGLSVQYECSVLEFVDGLVKWYKPHEPLDVPDFIQYVELRGAPQ